MSPLNPSVRDRVRAWRRRFRELLWRRETDRRVAAELALHLDLETEKRIGQGLSPSEARRAALLAFGGIDRTAEELRDVRSIGWIDGVARDLSHAARSLRRSPSFTLTAVATLALGVGATTAVFTVVRAVVLAPLPYADPARIVRMWESNAGQHVARGPVSPGTFVDVRGRARTLQSIALYRQSDAIGSDDRETWVLRVATVTPSFFDVLGARPAVGSVFAPESDARWAEPTSLQTALISDALWRQRFGGRRDILGHTLVVDARWKYTIVGVLAPGFAYPDSTEVWIPVTHSRAVSNLERQFRFDAAIAKLRPGVSMEDAARELSSIAAQLQTDYPASNAGWAVEIAPLGRAIVGDTRGTLLALFALAACVLLIACVNVATLFTARASARRHETAVRIALGAGWRDLARQWAAEAALLASLGGGAGTIVGDAATRGLLMLAPRGIPRLGEVRFGLTSFVFGLLAATLAAIAVAVAPLLRARDDAVSGSIRTRNANANIGGRRFGTALVGAQVALAFALTVTATLLVRSFDRLLNTDLGYDRAHVVAAELRVPIGRSPSPRPWFAISQYYDQLVTELARLPAVQDAAGTTRIPLTGENGSGSLWRTDAPGAHGRKPPTSAADQWKATIQAVTPRYFAAMGIPLLRGRAFDETDRFTEGELTDPQTPRPPGVAIINEAMAARYYANENPIGKTIFLFDDQTFSSYRTIVGVARDVRAESVAKPPAPTVFLPYPEHPGGQLSIVLRSALAPASLVTSVKQRLRSVDSSITVTSVRPLDAIVGVSLSRPRFTMLLAGVFAILALALSIVGVFGSVSFFVTSRTHEIGIRLALGARAAAVRRLVVADGLRPVVIGVVAGGAIAAAGAHAMEALLYEVGPLDPLSFAIGAAVLIVAATAAALIPANRAVRIDPLRSLRND